MSVEDSYRRHSSSWAEEAADAQIQGASRIWFDEFAIDTWRHARAYEAVNYLGEMGGAWLTVGDGRFGLDAQRLQKRGIRSVLPTDICEDLLKAAKDSGYIADYRIENGEDLSFPDNSFDFVFIKEAFHHFPRPPIALFEMLRVARKGVILVEPHDRVRSPLRMLLISLRSLIRGRRIHPDSAMYEEKDKNYVYSVSVREMEKASIALNLPLLAYKTYTDIYDPRVNGFRVGDFQYYILRGRIFFREILSKLGIDKNSIIQIMLLKSNLPASTRSAMKKANWTIIDLPTNPYASAPNTPPSSA